VCVQRSIDQSADACLSCFCPVPCLTLPSQHELVRDGVDGRQNPSLVSRVHSSLVTRHCRAHAAHAARVRGVPAAQLTDSCSRYPSVRLLYRDLNTHQLRSTCNHKVCCRGRAMFDMASCSLFLISQLALNIFACSRAQHGVISIQWHPTEPLIFSCSKDKTVRCVPLSPRAFTVR
jgi:WD40 repeat protein